MHLGRTLFSKKSNRNIDYFVIYVITKSHSNETLCLFNLYFCHNVSKCAVSTVTILFEILSTNKKCYLLAATRFSKHLDDKF